jgi:predicted glycosyltransferase
MRATIFSQRGLVTAIDPRELSAPRLAAAIVDSLKKPAPAAVQMPAMHGVKTVTRTLLNWLSDSAPSSKPWHERRSATVRGKMAVLR